MIDRKNIPVVVECYADNGEHSHFKLIDVETGNCLWEESETAHNSDYAKLPNIDELKSYMHRNKYSPNIIGTLEAIKKLGNFA